MRGWLAGVWRWFVMGPDPIGSVVPGWNPAVADRAHEDTARLLLGRAGAARVETAADRRRRELEAEGRR